LDGLLPASVPEAAIDHAFINVGPIGAGACDAQETANQVEAPPSAVANEPILGETRRVADELSVGADPDFRGGLCPDRLADANNLSRTPRR
jgi:hypothetical protein